MDVLQEFYVRVLKSFGDLKDDEKLRPRMNRVLQSAIADHFRLRARSERLEKAFERQVTVESQMIEEEIDLLVCACLYKLLPTLIDDYAVIIWRVGAGSLLVRRFPDGESYVRFETPVQDTRVILVRTLDCPEKSSAANIRCGRRAGIGR